MRFQFLSNAKALEAINEVPGETHRIIHEELKALEQDHYTGGRQFWKMMNLFRLKIFDVQDSCFNALKTISIHVLTKNRNGFGMDFRLWPAV